MQLGRRVPIPGCSWSGRGRHELPGAHHLPGRSLSPRAIRSQPELRGPRRCGVALNWAVRGNLSTGRLLVALQSEGQLQREEVVHKQPAGPRVPVGT
eukprot:54281-Alexandrium_andersonii.AAC.1